MLKRLIARGKTELHTRSVPASAAPAAAANGSEAAAMASASASSSSKMPAPPIVAVLSAKGGAGATTIAVNLAAVLSSGGAATTLVDANLQQPDAAHVVGAEPVHSVMELLARTAELDKQLFEACCTQIGGEQSTRLSLLSPPIDGQAAVTTTLSELAHCLAGIRSYRKCWVVDMPKHLDKHLVTLVDMCDRVLLVFEANVTGIATTQRWLSVFRELGYADDRIMCVLNRAGSKYSGIEQQLDTCFPSRPIFRVPNASSVIWECSTRGVPVVAAYPNHAYSRAIGKLAEQVTASISIVR